MTASAAASSFRSATARGRAISLGGRALDPNARAKYLNGPETELFDKGRNLYNHAPAREAAGKGQPLIVAEGYMDVIALVRGRVHRRRGAARHRGHRGPVAPDLAHRTTSRSSRWTATRPGIRAALRVIDLALPLLEAGQGRCALPSCPAAWTPTI